MLFRFLILVHVSVSFPLKCPEPAQWSTRARGFCTDPSKYFCLKNDLINGYSENCTIFDFLRPGRKNVLRGGLDADICSSDRYQPWPILFYTNVSTNCIFLKSACNEEGLVAFDKGNRNIDVTCRCDYTRGYDFIVKPRNPCFCLPSEEDCSCHLKMCPKATEKLSPDYECLEGEKNLTVSECKAIISVRTNTTGDDTTKKYISDRENITYKVINKKLLIAICIGSIFFFCMVFLSIESFDRYYREVYFIYQPLSDIELIEGQTTRLKYKLSTNRFPFSFLKDNQFIPETTNIKKSIVGRSKILEFTYVAPSDAGTYCLIVEETTSNQIKMNIKPMFTSKIDPQICFEGNKLELMCSVYTDNIVVQWYKENEQVHECENMLINTNKTQHMLTIKKATIMDSGKYYVKAGNVQMEVPVIVKDMFRRPLVDVTIMEGLDTKFEFETEEENVPVQWFYNKKEIFESTERRHIFRLQGRVHTLTILNTRLEDSGKYSIKIKAYDKFVELNVKAMFTSKIDPQICFEGNKLELMCSVYTDNIVVQWYKENEQVHECENMLINTNKTQHMLTIKKATIMDSGKYYVKAGNVQMEVPVIVKDMFRRPLVDVTIMEGLDTKFEFETEEENVPVQWFYNKKEIFESTERRHISRLQGRVHTLTILNTRLEDSGKYSIKIKAYDKFVELNVKEMPETIKNMSINDKEAFRKATQTGTAVRYYIRVMIVGKQSAGKTRLLRRLMNEEIDDVMSTDGINIERRKCHIDIKTGEWHYNSGQKPQVLSNDQSEELADCAFWDFAGQKEFYATHKTFLSANAVYLLVVDISEDFQRKTYENTIEKEFGSIGEYIDFWLDNIHCYCTDDKNTLIQCNEDGDLNPPVIIVGTGIDKIRLNDREEGKTSFLTHLNSSMSKQEKRRHFRKPYFLSNKIPSANKQEFEELRTDILCKAKTLSNWEENLPIQWTVLEKEMYRKQTETAILFSEVEGETPRYNIQSFLLSIMTPNNLSSTIKFNFIQVITY